MKQPSPSRFLTIFSLSMLTVLLSLHALHASTVGAMIPVEVSPPIQERPDVAYDPLHNRYLVVYSEGVGAGQEIMGRLVRDDGALFPPFNISVHPGQADSQPAVAFKAGTNEFLVVWRYGVAPATNHIFARRIRFDGTPLGGPFPVAMTAFDEGQPDVAADPLANGHYMVVWHEVGSASNRGQFLFSNGLPDGRSFELFSLTRTGPRVAYGHSNTANYFLTATTDVNRKALARPARPGPALGATMTLNVLPTGLGPGIGPSLAFHSTLGRWLVVWIGPNVNEIRGRFLNTVPAPLAPPDVIVIPPGGSLRSADVAAGFDGVFKPRFNVSFERMGEIFAISLDDSGVVSPMEPLFVDGVNNDSVPANEYNRARNEFFTVWQHNSDINGQRHELP